VRRGAPRERAKKREGVVGENGELGDLALVSGTNMSGTETPNGVERLQKGRKPQWKCTRMSKISKSPFSLISICKWGVRMCVCV